MSLIHTLVPWRPRHSLHQKATSSRAKRRFLSIILSIIPKLPLHFCLPATYPLHNRLSLQLILRAHLTRATPSLLPFCPCTSSQLATMNRIISLRNRDVIVNKSSKIIFYNTRLRCIIVASSTDCQCRKLVPEQEALLGGIRCTWHIKTLQVSCSKYAPCAMVVDANNLSEQVASPESERLQP